MSKGLFNYFIYEIKIKMNPRAYQINLRHLFSLSSKYDEYIFMCIPRDVLSATIIDRIDIELRDRPRLSEVKEFLNNTDLMQKYGDYQEDDFLLEILPTHEETVDILDAILDVQEIFKTQLNILNPPSEEILVQALDVDMFYLSFDGNFLTFEFGTDGVLVSYKDIDRFKNKYNSYQEYTYFVKEFVLDFIT